MNQYTYSMTKRLEEAGYSKEDIEKIFLAASFTTAVGIVSRRIKGMSKELAFHLAKWKLREDEIAAGIDVDKPKLFHGHAGENINKKGKDNGN